MYLISYSMIVKALLHTGSHTFSFYFASYNQVALTQFYSYSAFWSVFSGQCGTEETSGLFITVVYRQI